MEHIRSFLLAALAVVVAAATAAAAGLPPLPSTMPADVPQPEIPPCLNDLMPCASVYDDSSMLGPCCDALGKVFKSDRACLCQIWEMARNDTRQVGSNALDGDQQMFARCKIPGASSTICDNGQAGASWNIGRLLLDRLPSKKCLTSLEVDRGIPDLSSPSNTVHFGSVKHTLEDIIFHIHLPVQCM
ncbi:Os10g0193100 [Oryza sativa Japonica Group]|uniref:Os10g0193100 protein n=1 Tax=Oryza sativa subsp. japonica TaxID=39947 RepID=Q0IYM0_ORYSJ|nr:Os10g0193100 [Oryza sativa Japonica Group]|eukprot:NP_001064281.2 Os10g0193100 [Oryza sativa Japonica Group]